MHALLQFLPITESYMDILKHDEIKYVQLGKKQTTYSVIKGLFLCVISYSSSV